METIEKKRLSKKDIIKSYLIWTFFSHSTYNYERMQASRGAAYSWRRVWKNYTEKRHRN